MTLRHGDRVGPYEIVGTLGAGGMGEVYRARDTRLGRTVALKLLSSELAKSPDTRARFRREATAAAALAHSNICTIFEIGDADDRPYIAMECIEGETLETRMRGRPLSVDEVLRIAIQLADALDEARRNHIVHRDLKPANIALTPKGDVKILDFGLAKQVLLEPQESTAVTQMTQAGMILGTLSYMAPEQARGRAVDHRTDLFAFGVVLYEVLTGRKPFEGDTAVDVTRAIVHDQPVAIPRFNPKVPDPLARAVMKLLEKDPDCRYQTAGDLRNDLRRIRDEARIPASPAGAMPLLRAPRRRYAAIALLATCGIAATVLLLARLRYPAPSPSGVVLMPAKVYGAADYAYLTDAVPATLSSQLAQIPGLDMKVPPSSLEVERVGGDLGRIAAMYGAGTCVLSSITAEADSLVLNVQLVEPQSRRVRWSHDYAGQRGRYLDLAHQAADGLRAALAPASTVATVQPVTTNSDAELAFRRGQHHRRRLDHLRDPRDFQIARDALLKALELDPQLAEAAVEMAYLYAAEGQAGQLDSSEAFPQMNAWAHKALQLNDRNGPAWAALAEWEWLTSPAGADVLKHALLGARLGVRCGECQNILAGALALSSVRLSMAALWEGRRLDPLSAIPTVNLATALSSMGRGAEALSVIDAAFEIDPNIVEARKAKVMILVGLGRLPEAAPMIRALEPDVRAKRLSLMEWLVLRYAAAQSGGDLPSISASLEALMNAVKGDRVSTWELSAAQDAVPFMAARGHLDAAVEVLSRGLDLNIVPAYDWLILNPHFDRLRRDSRFTAIRGRVQTQFRQMTDLLEGARSRGELPPYLESPLVELLRDLPPARRL